MSRRGWVLFLVMGVVWGIPYLLIKVVVEDVPPATMVFLRTALATLLLLPVALARGVLRPVLPHWRPVLVFAVIEMCIPWLMLGYAEQHLSSSLAGLLVAAVPLVGAVLVKATGHEHIGLRRVAGLLVGFAGVAVLVGFDVETSSPWPVVAMAVVACGYAVGPLVLDRHLSHLPNLGVVTSSLAITCVAFLPAGLAQWPAEAPGADTWLSLAGLAVICTAVAFLLVIELVAEVGPARTTVITYVNPVVAVALGWAVLDERVTAATGVGFLLILVGSIVGTRREEPTTVAAAVDGAGAQAGRTTAPDGVSSTT
jgi:drug/metabolite transporter (DMT)-like permease